jgi:endonuclease YncB( thermonuclease family)
MHCRLATLKLRIVVIMICFTVGLSPVWGWQPPSGPEKTDPKPSEPTQEKTPTQEEMFGKVEKIIDGDSIKIREEGGEQVHEIQIEGTDAPEAKQAYGKESTEALRKILLDQKVRITWTKKDNFGRRLAQVYLGDDHINQRMIRDGHAWHFKRYNQSQELAKLEEEARKAKRGLWATDNPQAPWDYRKENRTPDKPDR